MRVGTRRSPLALVQTRDFIARAIAHDPALAEVLEEHALQTTGDAVQDRRLAEIGGKGLFAKEIHEALLDRRIDCAVHSLKDLETSLPDGIVLACVLPREDCRDALVLGRGVVASDPADPLAVLRQGALIGTSSVRRQAQLLHARRDLRVAAIRGNVQSRLAKLRAGDCDATLLALAGLRRLDMAAEASVVLAPEFLLPAAAQGIVGVTARAGDFALLALLAALEDPASRAMALAERGLLAVLDGSCATPIAGQAVIRGETLRLTGLVARADGSFLVRRALEGAVAEAAPIGAELGARLKAECPADVFAGPRG